MQVVCSVTVHGRSDNWNAASPAVLATPQAGTAFLRWLCGFWSGHPSQEDLQEKERYLRAEIERDNSRADGDGWLFARYNKEVFPYGPFRRNDLLIPLEVRCVGAYELGMWR